MSEANLFEKIRLHISNRTLDTINEVKKSIRKLYPEQHQLTSTTYHDRYPEIFSFIKENFTGPYKSVLSFGCSTGEECITISNYLNPEQVIGADINRMNLKQAKKNNSLPSIKYLLSDIDQLKKHGQYDVIFALSVLCRWDDTKDLSDCSAIYPFEKFDTTIKELFSLLAPKGLLVVYNANFKVEDTSIAEHVKPFKIPGLDNSGFVTKFNRNNKREEIPHTNIVFQKM